MGMKCITPDVGNMPTAAEPATTVAFPQVVHADFDEPLTGAGGSVPGQRNRLALRVA
jgi:hypothetical protein